MNRRSLTPGFIASLCFGLAAPVYAQITAYDANVTNNAIWGSGNANGGFTVSTVTSGSHTVELGLRTHLRYDVPANVFNSLGNGTYVWDPVSRTGNPTTPIWSFDWSINTDPTGLTGDKLDDFTYLLSMDFDPAPGSTLTQSFDLMNPANHPLGWWDHSIGTNTTLNGQGTEAISLATYTPLVANNNLAQNSWNYEFFNDGPYAVFNPTTPGVYTITLSWFGDYGATGSTSINVQVIPEPSTYAALMGLAVLGIVGYKRFRRRSA